MKEWLVATVTRQIFCKCFERRSEIARIIAYGPSEDFRTETNLEGFNSLQYVFVVVVVHDAMDRGRRYDTVLLACVAPKRREPAGRNARGLSLSR